MRVQVALLLAVAAAGLAGAGATSGPEPSFPAADLCEPSYIPHLGSACVRSDGFYDVVLASGQRLRTHGPDPLLPPADEGELGWGEDAEQRPLVCADQWSMRVLYGHPSDQSDRTAQVADEIRASLRRMNAVLHADAVASGGISADFKVRCDASGDIRIDTFSTSYASGAAYTQDFGQIVDGAQAAGHDDAKSDYLIFWDAGSTVCGVGNLAADDSASPSNENMAGPDYGVVYDSCWDGRTPMHENGHTQGAVQDLAPMWDGSGHCIEGYDVMCYPGESGFTGTATLGLVVQCTDRVHYDCNFDTYFDAAPEAGEWLASHWNIGSPVNRYVALADTSSPRSGSSEAAAAMNETVPDPSANATASSSLTSTAASPSKSASSTRTATPSTSSRTSRIVADPRATATGAPATGGTSYDGQVTVEVPAAAWIALAALGGVAALRRRLR